jgi:hypothetical protein
MTGDINNTRQGMRSLTVKCEDIARRKRGATSKQEPKERGKRKAVIDRSDEVNIGIRQQPWGFLLLSSS